MDINEILMSKEYKGSIDKMEILLQEPLKNRCYMVSLPWWNTWFEHVKISTKNVSPIIDNYSLIDNGEELKFTLQEKQLVQGNYNGINWYEYNLKKELKEGEDYVLIGEPVWNLILKNYASPIEICIFIVNSAPKSENYLQTPYAHGYPDLSPVKIMVENTCLTPYDEKYCMEILISLNCTCIQLHEYLMKLYPNMNKFVVNLISGSSNNVTIPKNDKLLSKFKFSKDSKIYLAPFYSIMISKNKGLPLLNSELCEGLTEYRENLGNVPVPNEFEENLKRSRMAMKQKISFRKPSLKVLHEIKDFLKSGICTIVAKYD